MEGDWRCSGERVADDGSRQCDDSETNTGGSSIWHNQVNWVQADPTRHGRHLITDIIEVRRSSANHDVEMLNLECLNCLHASSVSGDTTVHSYAGEV